MNSYQFFKLKANTMDVILTFPLSLFVTNSLSNSEIPSSHYPQSINLFIQS